MTAPGPGDARKTPLVVLGDPSPADLRRSLGRTGDPDAAPVRPWRIVGLVLVAVALFLAAAIAYRARVRALLAPVPHRPRRAAEAVPSPGARERVFAPASAIVPG